MRKMCKQVVEKMEQFTMNLWSLKEIQMAMGIPVALLTYFIEDIGREISIKYLLTTHI